MSSAKALVRRTYLRPGAVRRLPVGLGAGLRLEVVENGSIHTYLGTAELEIARHVRRLARPGQAAYDVGSHDGYYGMALARLTGAPVLSFDADPSAIARMRRNLARNPAVARRVEVVERFVGEGEGGIDHMVEREGRPVPGFLKVDVDGGEAGVLEGARRTLERHRPGVVVEVHSPGLERATGDLLAALGYRVVVVPQRKRLRQNRPAPHNRWLVATP